MKFILASALFVAATVAQYQIVPTSVSNSTRQQWCTSQEAQCPLICLQTNTGGAVTLSNTCDWQTLTYSCVCGNGLSPNVSQYSETLPYFICTEWGTQCVSNCGSDNACQSACRQDHPCGAQHPTRVNTSTISTTMSSTASSSGSGNAAATTDGSGQTIYSGFAGATPTATSGNSGTQHSGANTVRVWALSAGQTFGSLGLAGLLFGGFAMIL